MPEGDTVLRTARRLHAVFAGHRLTRAELRWGTLSATSFDRAVTTEVVARGKHLLHRFDCGITLHSHLRMEGSWHVHPAARAPRPGTSAARDSAVRAVLGTSEYVALGLRLGMLDVVETAAEHTLVGHLGPDVLGDDWDEDVAVARLLGAQDRVAAALLDQRNLAGIGTLYCCESLFLERIDPWSPVDDLTDAGMRRLVRRARRLLHANLAHAVQSTTGVRRRGEEKYVHARAGRPCRRCGTSIRVGRVGTSPTQRAMFYCPRCQRTNEPPPAL